MIKLASYLGIDIENKLIEAYKEAHNLIPIIEVEQVRNGYRVTLKGRPNISDVGRSPEEAGLKILRVISPKQYLSDIEMQKLHRQRKIVIDRLKEKPTADLIRQLKFLNDILSAKS
jgi:hypothetical protein